MEFDYKKILIYGYEKSGRAVENVLKDIKVNYMVYDRKNKIMGGNLLNKLNKKILSQFDLVVISPGISIYDKYVKMAENLGVKVIGELEFGFWFTSADVIAVTGTNGKTTTTHLINLALKQAGYKSDEFGNIGNPLTNAYKKDLDYIVCETSSFQLETTDKFAPYVSVLLNVAQDHIDRHKTFENYIKVKKSIFKNCDVSDYAVINIADENCAKISKEITGKQIVFNSENGFELRKNKLFFKSEFVLEINKKLLNYTYPDNILATICALDALDIDLGVINKIKPNEKMPHRLEKFASSCGVNYIDDSKATNPHSTLKAVSEISGDIVLLLGGKNKGFDFDDLISKLPDNVKIIVCFGECGKKIYKVCKKYSKQVYYGKTLEIAINMAYNVTKQGDNVLLSPACASFDEFDGYDKRGEFFKSVINKLVSKNE